MSMKIIKMTESDISRLIKRIISEQDDLEPDASDFGGPKFEKSKLMDKDFRDKWMEDRDVFNKTIEGKKYEIAYAKWNLRQLEKELSQMMSQTN